MSSENVFERLYSLKGKRALVTGASSGIGRAIATCYAEAGATVGVHGTNEQKIVDTVQSIEALGGSVVSLKQPLASKADSEALIAQAVEKLGGIDILVNNAANRGHNKIVDMPFAEWKEITSIILDGGFLCTRAAVKLMTPKKWGRVIFLGGIGPHLGYKERCHVSAGKMGSVGMMHCLATELAADGITVNVVAPGRIGGKRAPSAGEPTGIVPPVGFVGGLKM